MAKKECTACGEPMEAHWKSCPLCGFEPDSADASDIELEDAAPPPPRATPTPPTPTPPTPAPPILAEPTPPPAEEPEPDAPPEDPPAAAEPEEDDEPEEGTMRMSMGDATKAWLEDSEAAGALAPAVPTAEPKSKMKLLIVALVVVVVVFGVLMFVL